MSDYSWNMSDLENALGITYDELDDEIKGLDESKALKTTKTLEEIERYITDEDFTEVQKALHLLKTGSTTQKMWVLTELPNFLKFHPQDFYSKIMPEVLNCISSENSQIQKSFGQNISIILSNPNEFSLDSKFVVSSLYPVLKRQSQAYPNDEEWEDFLLQCLDFMDHSVLINEILQDAISSAGMSLPVKNRMWCCKVIGKLTKILLPEVLENNCLKKALELSQDTDYEVRSNMSAQLSYFAASLGWEKTKSLIFNDYKELLNDEHEEVRISALDHLPTFTEQMDDDTKKTHIWPFWRQLLEESLSFGVEEIVSRDFGIIFWNLKGVMDNSDKVFVAKRFMEMVRSGSPKLRTFAAFNFPAIVKIADPENFEIFNVFGIMKIFEDDKIPEIRKKYAQGFHEIANILAGKFTKRARESFSKLSSDSDCSVIKTILDRADQTLFHLKDEKEDHLPNEMFTPISNLTARLGKLKWREQKELLAGYQKIVPFFESEIQYTFASKTLLPLLLPQTNTRPVSKTIIKDILFFCRLMKKVDCRDKLIKDMIQELKFSTCYLHRVYFLEFCRYSLKYGSKKFFRDNLLSHYLDMYRDSATSIRMKMLNLAPEARKCLRVLTKDNVLSLKWFEAFQRLSQDKDEQIRSNASDVLSLPTEFAEKDPNLKIIGSLSRSEYYLNSNERSNESEEQLDQEREEEEDKYKIQQMFIDEATKRRELEEAKNEFSRRLKAEKRNSVTTKSTGNGLKGQQGLRKVGTATFAGKQPPSSTGAFITKSSSYVSVGGNTNSNSISSSTTSVNNTSSNVSKSTTKGHDASNIQSYSITSKASQGKVDSPRVATKNGDNSTKSGTIEHVSKPQNPSHGSKEKISGGTATTPKVSKTAKSK